MAGKTISKEDLTAAVKSYCSANGKDSSIGEDGKIRIFAGTPDPVTDKVLWLEGSRLSCDDMDFALSFAEDYLKPSVMPVNGGSQPSKAIIPSQPRKAGNGALVKPGAAIRDIQVCDLSQEDIKNHICPGATDQEAFMFLKLCQARNLNPFTGEAYLVKYGQGKASMVVGKEAFTRKAEVNPQFDGMEAGIIVKSTDNGPEFERPGAFVRHGEVLIGGWARVYRKDRRVAFYSEVSLGDYRRPTQSGKAPWDTMPAVMIRKVALVSALREAFPSDLSGMYDQAEMGINPENEVLEAV